LNLSIGELFRNQVQSDEIWIFDSDLFSCKNTDILVYS
jgi:hypothetical protein